MTIVRYIAVALLLWICMLGLVMAIQKRLEGAERTYLQCTYGDYIACGLADAGGIWMPSAKQTWGNYADADMNFYVEKDLPARDKNKDFGVVVFLSRMTVPSLDSCVEIKNINKGDAAEIRKDEGFKK